MTTTASRATINGVDVTALNQSIAAMREDPGMAAFQFRSSSRWTGGAVVASTFAGNKQDGLYVTHSKPHELGGDEPVALLGTGTQMSPTGHLIHALSHPLAVTMAYHGAARGMKIDSMRIDVEGKLDLHGLLVTGSYHAAARGMALEALDVDLEGDMDMRGFADLDDMVFPGYKSIRGRVYIKAGAPKKKIEEFMKFATKHAPMCNSVAVQLTYSLVHNGRYVGGPAGEQAVPARRFR